MDAIEAVVREHGVAGLSIEAVARAAGISKSSVVYDFSSKNALLAAFVRKRLDQKHVDLEAAAEGHEGQPDAFLKGMLGHCAQSPSDEDISCAMAITASFADDNTCRELMATAFREDLERVVSEASDPARARLVWAALHGVMALEYLGFHHFPPDERRQLLADIASLLSAPLPST
ncbi:TetR/AcrR family transcriptional regulator [Falsirhodobacter sp. 20TX0035]|uniref:TetR/AcrR family transcriptional regulator n=1 Tax=Falsirhodobacter sp. 20TX0035 TaxID=3022019 RepID=UPI00232D8B12|nr:TetR/AcrR family transcriptional regulator [Falsirhodobacter sp. 20TX0035]MDB6452794.1 TetR/AcrR family transcriptional regulator [Falsirhodobacter sp. 20TX0035]